MSRALIMGGSGGIGAAVVERLCGEGWRVAFTYRRNEERARVLVEATGAEALHYDQGVPDSIESLVARVRQDAFDGLVVIAAPAVRRQLLLKTDPELFLREQVEALRGVLRVSSAFAARVKERGAQGSIVTVLSSYVLGMPPAKLASYVTGKHALLGLTRSMAVEFVRHGVRVNAVSPAMTKTDFIADLPERFIEEIEATLPLERVATPKEVANVICFLLSSDASYMNGANIPITGGQAC